MIRKYGGFLLENFRYNARLILEAELSATAGFLDKLDVISKEKGMAGEIAKNIKDISLNDRKIFIDEQGNFKEQLLLSYGYNVFKIKANDKFGRSVEKIVEIIYK